MGSRRQVALRVNVVGLAPGRAAVGLGRWLSAVAPSTAVGEVTIALISDARMRRLNRLYRGVDAPTDVLSFPPGELVADGRADARSSVFLGDLAIALGVARGQAQAFGHSLGTELRILALHGLLHLLGYDHERDRGTMRRLENELRRRAGLPTGLISRARRSSR